MKQDSANINKICQPEFIKQNKPPADPNMGEISIRQYDDLFANVESTISYILQNKFCSPELEFKVDVFEKYVKDLINGLCESDDWKKSTSDQLTYLLKKPMHYLPE